MKKRSFASEGHLQLPRDLAPPPARVSHGTSHGTSQSASPPTGSSVLPQPRPSGAGWKVLGHAPFDPEGRTRTAQVLGDAMAAHGLRTGDRVVLALREEPEFGDLIALASRDDATAGTLWKAYPEAGVLHLRCGDERLSLPPDESQRVAGVVIAVRRALTP